MSDKQVALTIEPERLKHKVQELLDKGYRLTQMHCTKAEDGFELYYSFETIGLELRNLKFPVNLDSVIPSISGIFLCAFLYENEIHDLFGITFTDIAVDFQGKLYQTAVKVPYGNSLKVKTVENNAIGSTPAETKGVIDNDMEKNTAEGEA